VTHSQCLRRIIGATRAIGVFGASPSSEALPLGPGLRGRARTCSDASGLPPLGPERVQRPIGSATERRSSCMNGLRIGYSYGDDGRSSVFGRLQAGALDACAFCRAPRSPEPGRQCAGPIEGREAAELHSRKSADMRLAIGERTVTAAPRERGSRKSANRFFAKSAPN
jgi:hypothetical protein